MALGLVIEAEYSARAKCHDLFVRLALLGVLLGAPILSGQAKGQDMPLRGTAGAFLSSRVAVTRGDFGKWLPSHDRLLQADTDNPGFQEMSMQGHLLAGNFERAAERAAQITGARWREQCAALVMQADAFKRGAYDAALAGLETAHAPAR